MKRRLFTILSALSLVLSIACVVLWARGYVVSEHIARATLSGPACVVRSSGGVIYFDHRSFWQYEGGWTWGRRRIPFGDDAVHYAYQTPSGGVRFGGFGVFSGTAYTWPGHLYPGVAVPTNMADPRWWRDRYTTVSVPHWAMILLLSVLPYLRWKDRLWAYRRNRRLANGLCPRCGYDLRASKERCPECGAPIPVQATTGKA